MVSNASRVLLLLPVLAGTLEAQNYRDVTDSWSRPRNFFGINLQVAAPQGEFKQFVGTGFGVGLNVTFMLDREGRVGIRLFGSWIEYGRTTERLPLSPTLPGLNVDLTTANDIYTMGVGPELQLGRGDIRPYLHGMIGTSNFATTTSAEGTNNTSPFASSTNFNDWTFAWSGGGGVMFQVSHGRHPVLIDGGLRYQGHGQTRYLREGSIQPAPGGGVTFTPIESRTDILVPYLGVQVGF
jgi:hypothetical protein